MEIFVFFSRIYKRSKESGGLYGFFQLRKPALILGTPELIKQVTIKDFDHFTDHRTINFGKFFGKNLFSLNGKIKLINFYTMNWRKKWKLFWDSPTSLWISMDWQFFVHEPFKALVNWTKLGRKVQLINKVCEWNFIAS